MSDLQHSAVIAREAGRLADVLAGCNPGARVPTCPDWTAKDLLWHLATVHRFWSTILREDPQGDEVEAIEGSAPAEPPTVADMLPLRAGWTADLVAQLDALPDATPRWSWSTEHTVGFTRRMQLAEATMHRVDAELTAGLPVTPLEPTVAALAIDHAVDVMFGVDVWLAWLPADTRLEGRGTVALRATDADRRWLVDVVDLTGEADGRPFQHWALRRRESGDADATVAGSLHDLACWVWTRPGPVATSGDASVLDALLALHGAGIA